MRRVDGRILRATGRDYQVHTAFQQRGGNHEDDEQHKSEIEQRRDINLAQGGEILALRVASHCTVTRLKESDGISSAKRGFPRTVIDIFVLKLRCELGGEIIHLHDDPANTGDEKVITEHCGNRDT